MAGEVSILRPLLTVLLSIVLHIVVGPERLEELAERLRLARRVKLHLATEIDAETTRSYLHGASRWIAFRHSQFKLPFVRCQVIGQLLGFLTKRINQYFKQ